MEGCLETPEICTALIDKPRQNPHYADLGIGKIRHPDSNILRHTRRNLAMFDLSSSAMCKLAATLVNPSFPPLLVDFSRLV
jgi:hypothetical protein